MTTRPDPLIPALLPPTGENNRAPAGRRGAPSSLDVAPIRHRRVVTTVYGIRPVDNNGRVVAKSVVATLGWVPATRLDMLVHGEDVVVVRADEHGRSTLTDHHQLHLPARIRRQAGIQPGHRVLLAADAHRGVLLVVPIGVIDQLLEQRLDGWGG
ncbi:hypothetical protein APR11_004386 [Nocardia amikacinitolerans]|uniref:hypothetical protein n=1 Tax=Nocardia amikacinitolerans TaxID=756689 RepID=UPI0020A48477|nr:hypothetical protein [Nocardia amikacinitolerans]MCP2297945.1 hypothetical protein [Nocardia amikacinitolerans]